MKSELILASASEIRATLLRNAGLLVSAMPARVDEETVRAALEGEGAAPRDIADALAEAKARKVSAREPGLVLGCDQVLDLDGRLLSKPRSEADALEHLYLLRGKTHRLWSAAVVYDGGEPVWRYVSRADLTMRDASDRYLEDYVARNWESIQHAVGAYKLEEEGVRLFTQIKGDYFTILGLPLLDILSWLTLRGTLPS